MTDKSKELLTECWKQVLEMHAQLKLEERCGLLVLPAAVQTRWHALQSAVARACTEAGVKNGDVDPLENTD